MLLTADIGNTNITLALFEGDKYINEFRLASDKDLSGEEYEILLKSLFKDYLIEGCVIASVVEELNVKFKRAVDNVFNITSVFVAHDINLGIKVKTDNPQEVGADRLANAVAAANLYKGAVIVIDFGTATSFDIINSKHEFLGGVIAPGINTQMKCLKTSTSKLPRIDVTISQNAIGHNTTDAILSGVIRGTACMVDGLVAQCEAELAEKATIVATGGYCGLIANYLNRPFDIVNPILTLEGLRLIYGLNTDKKKKETCMKPKHSCNFGGGGNLLRPSNKLFLGFTLAEVLITLGVIGIVASITLPGLITAHKRVVLASQFKRAKSQLFQAVRLWQEEETEDLWGTYYHPTDQNGTALRSGFYKYLKGSDGTYDRVLESDLKTYYTSAKGSQLKAHYCPSNCCTHPVKHSFTTFDGIMYNVCTRDGQINFSFDINGYDKGPNKWGVDLFDFDMNENNVLFNNYSCSSSNCQVYFHSRGGGGFNDGIGCTACAVKDNDYFKNIEL